jgi:hypothetical protein
MTTKQLQNSLAEWRRKERYRQRKLDYYHKVNNAKAIAKWERLHNEAVRMVHKRLQDIADAKPLRLKAYSFATTLVGVMEQGGNNNGPVVAQIIRANGGVVGEPWCGDFQAFVYRHVGSKAVTRSWASVAMLGSLLGVKRTTAPQKGDLVRFKFDHVGMFVKDNGDGTITTIEGNTGASGAVSDSKTGGDGVYKKVRSKTLVADYLHITK